MKEMIERVAKALFEYDQNREFNNNLLLYRTKDKVTWEFVNSPEVIAFIGDDYRHKARAAIEAMREPTQEMTNVGIRIGVDCGMGLNYNHYDEVYRAMIDKALK